MIGKFSGPFYLQFHSPQMRFSLVFTFNVDCAKCHKLGVSLENGFRIYLINPITFSFKPLIFFIVNRMTIHAVEIIGR